MNKNILVALGIIGVVGVSYIALFQNSPDSEVSDISIAEEDQIAQREALSPEQFDEVVIMESEEVARGDERSISEPIATAFTAGTFETYSADKVASATGDTIIFFHATWCPSCRALSADIKENASTIPTDTTILKADYDTETDLKKKYGVTTQHTLVQVNNDGELIKKWSGGSKLENLLSQIQ